MTTPDRQPIALLVNDDPGQLHLASTIPSRDGIEVISCSGAEPALDVLAEGAAVDVIVTDLYMPRIDGWRLCRLLRSDAYREFNQSPIVGLSATFSGADAEEITAQLGPDAFLSSPYEPQVLRQLVRNLLGNTRPKILTHVLIVDPDPGFGTDRREFVANAFKFTPDGGQITVSAEPREGEAVVTVRDTGRGIDPKKIPSLFQKFQRLESSEPQDGLGLGLYIVKELVTAHGGRTEVEGVIGQGSAFSIFLPL